MQPINGMPKVRNAPESIKQNCHGSSSSRTIRQVLSKSLTSTRTINCIMLRRVALCSAIAALINTLWSLKSSTSRNYYSQLHSRQILSAPLGPHLTSQPLHSTKATNSFLRSTCLNWFRIRRRVRHVRRSRGQQAQNRPPISCPTRTSCSWLNSRRNEWVVLSPLRINSTPPVRYPTTRHTSILQ